MHVGWRWKLSVALSSLIALTLSGAVRAAAPSTQPGPRVVELHGTAAELGKQHGEALGESIRLLQDRYMKAYMETDASRMLARSVANMFEAKLLPEHRDEVKALAAAARIDERDAMLGNCFLDLSPMTACSTVTLPADAAPDHVARFGRNLDFMSFGVADKQSVVLVYHPTDRYAFAAVTWPGVIGCLSGMNEHGLTLANMEVTRPSRAPVAMPYVMLYRTVLERCRTVDEAIALLQKTPRQTANNLMLMDASGNRAVVEIQPQGISVRRGHDHAALISTNHQRDQDQDTPGKCDRYDALHDLCLRGYGRIDEKQIESMLARASQADFTMQSMVFEPATHVLYLSCGENAAHGTFSRIDLAEYFRH
jgi:isopenicillin-N N-acyltransferase-like protein